MCAPMRPVRHGPVEIASRAGATASSFKAGAKLFSKPGASELKVRQSGPSGDLAFWTGLQHARVRMGKDGEVVPMTLRITEVFRFEDSGWKLAHRYADIKDGRGE